MKLSLIDPQFILAIFWSAFCALTLGYIVVHYGDDKNILLLIIGLINGGIIGAIMGVYFNASHDKKTPPGTTTVIDATTTTVTKTPVEQKEVIN